MKLKALAFLPLLLLAAAAFASPEDRDEERPNDVVVKLSKATPLERVSGWIRGLGKVERKNEIDGSYTIVLRDGVSAEATVRSLRAKPGVEVAMTGAQHAALYAFKSLRSMRRHISELEHAAEERASKLGPLGLPVMRGKEDESKAAGTDYLESLEFRMSQRAYPEDKVNWAAYDEARRHRDEMPATQIIQRSGQKQSMAVSRWEFMGPRNLDIPYQIYYGVRPIVGRVNGIAYHRTNSNIFYVATSSGGIWKTTNGGTSFTPLSDQWQALETSCIAVHPGNSAILFVGTGDFHGFGGYGFGLLKSIDSGNTWTNILSTATIGRHAISSILVDPDNTNIMTVTTGRAPDFNGRVWRSTNGGFSWNVAINVAGHWEKVVASAGNATIGRNYYATCGGPSGRLYKSTDRGATWGDISGLLPVSLSSGYYDAVDIACSPTARDTAYLLVGAIDALYKTTDAGATWTSITAGFPAGYEWSQQWYDRHITVSTDPNTGQDVVYVGLIDLVQSPNGGASWRPIGATYTGSALTHNDQHSMAINPLNPNEALFGNDGGLFRLVYNPAGAGSWTITSLNLGGGWTEFYAAASHPTNPNIFLGGTQDNASPYANGDVNNWTNPGAGDGGFCAINPANPNFVYHTWQFLGMARTVDNFAATNDDISPAIGSDNVAFIAPIAMDNSNPHLVYAGTNFLYQWNENTDTWASRLGGHNFGGSASAISVAPSNGNVIYVGTSNALVWRTGDAGATWTQINGGVTPLPNRFIKDISVDPTNPNNVLVGVSGTGTGHLWRCTDTTVATGSRIWQNVSGAGATGLPNVPLNGIARDVDDPALSWHVATDVGVFTTLNGGSTWTNSTLPLGLPNVICNDIHMVAATRILYVATWGRGVWRITLPARNAVTNLTVNDNDMSPGDTATGTVTLANPAGASGEIVSLASNDKSLTLPETVTVPNGATTANFTLTCVNVDTGIPTTNVTVTASRPGSVASATVLTRIDFGRQVQVVVPDRAFSGQNVFTWQDWQNIGGSTWTPAGGYVLMSRNPTNNTTFGTNRIPIPVTIAPNQVRTVFHSFVAPAPGVYNWQWSMNHEGAQQFQWWGVNRQINVIPNPGNNALFVSQSVPTTVEAGNDFVGSVTMQNTGTTTWTHAGRYWLHSQDPTNNFIWWTNRVYMPGAASVAPGNTQAFSRNFTAPTNPGNYKFRWKMSWDDVDFGQLTPTAMISVTPAGDNAQFISITGQPSSVPRNTTFTANITFRNTGSNTWTQAGGYQVAAQWPVGNTFWGVGTIAVPAGGVAPNATHTFTATFTAPSTPGTYLFQWRMRNTAKPGFGMYSGGLYITVT